MWWIWILRIFLFLFIIYLGHATWDYVKNTISKPKTKDLVNIQTDKYRNMIQELSQSLLEKEKKKDKGNGKDIDVGKSNEVEIKERINKEENENSVIEIYLDKPSQLPELQKSEETALSMENQLEIQMDLEQFMLQLT